MRATNTDAKRFRWWFTESKERENARNAIRDKRETSDRAWSVDDWRKAIDEEMERRYENRR